MIKGKSGGLQVPAHLVDFTEIAFNAVVAFDSQTRIAFWNPAAERLFGWTAAEALGKNPGELFWPVNSHQEREDQRKRQTDLDSGRTLRGEHKASRKDGSFFWVEYTTRAAFDQEGKISGYVTVYRDITEQKHTTEELERIEDEIRLVAKMPAENPNPVMRLTPDGQVVYANDAARPLLDFWKRQTGQMVGGDVQAYLRESFETGTKKVVEVEYDGKTLTCTLAPIREAGYINFYGNDITERKRVEQRLLQARTQAERAIKRLARLQNVTAGLSEAVTLAQVAEILVVHGVPALSATSGSILLISKDGLMLEMLHTSAPETISRPYGRFPLALNVPASDALRSGLPIWIKSREEYLQRYPHLGGQIEAWGLQAAAAVPLIAKERKLGVLTLSFKQVQEFDTEVQDFALTLAQQGAQALERAQLFQQMQLTLSELQMTYDQSPIGMIQLDTGLRYIRVNETLARYNGIPAAEHIGKSIQEIVPDLTPKLLDGFRRVMETGEPVFNVEIVGETKAEPGVPHKWLESWYPLREMGGRVVGLNIVVQDVTKRKRDEQALAEFARQQEALYQLADKLHRMNSLEDTFDAALEAILAALQCDRASILLFDDSGTMRFVAWRGLSDAYRRATTGHSPWKPDEKNPQPIYFQDIGVSELDNALKSVIQEEGIQSLAFIPLVFDGKLIGIFMAYFNQPHIFNMNELDLSLTIAHQLAFGIQRSRADEALRTSQALYRAIARSIPDGGVFVLDRDFRYLVAEGAVIDHFGLSKAKLEGRTIFEVFKQETSAIMKERLQRNFAGETIDYETRQDGAVYWTQQTPLLDSHGHVLIITIDITERKHAEESLHVHAWQQQAVAKLGELALRERNLQQVFQQATAVVAETLGNEYCKVLELLPDGKELLLRAGVGWKKELVGKATISTGLDSQAGYTLLSDVPVIVEDLQEEKRFSGPALLTDLHVISGMSCVIRTSDAMPWGVLETHTTRRASFTGDDVNFLVSVANILGDAIRREQDEQALRESKQQLQLLNESLEQKVMEQTAEVRNLASDLTKAEQRERHRIAHILHDDLQQRLYAIRMQVELLSDGLQQDDTDLQRDVEDVKRQLSEAVLLTRHLSVDLSPPILRDEGLTQAVDWLASQMRETYGLQVDLQATGPFIIPDEDIHMLLFNCVRELLFNIVKHAGVKQAVVSFQQTADAVRIEVRDEGKGFDLRLISLHANDEADKEDVRPPSFGLPALYHRLSLFGGRMDVLSKPGEGTSVVITVPLNR